MRRCLSLMTLLLALPASLIGCGGAGGAGAGPDVETHYLAQTSKVRSLDPMLIQDTTSASVASQIYDTLYTYHYLKRPYELVPSLAAEMPQISDDRLTYTIKIRDDVYFADDPCFPNGEGRELVAQDFIYSWKRLADIHGASPNWPFLQGRIKGLDEFRTYTRELTDRAAVDYGRPISGLKAVDDHTLRITLTRPWPQAVYVLAHLPTAPVPREAVEYYGEDFINHPVGTGAFMLERWRRGSEIVLVRNPNFREEYYPSEGEPGDKERGLLEDAGKRLPLVDRVQISIIQESQPYWLTFMNGRTDVAGIPKDNFGQAIAGGAGNRELSEDLKQRGIEMRTLEDPGTFWIGFNMKDPVVGDNLPLRRALSMAINREDYLELFLNGRGQPAHGLFPPTPGFAEVYNPDLKSPFTHYNPEKARELVEKAREVHGGPLPTLELALPGTDATTRQTGQYLSRAWREVGLDVSVEYMDWPTFQRQVDNQSTQMFQMGWLADYPDPQNFLMLYYGPNAPSPNSTGYDNPEFNELYEKMITMPLGPERSQVARELEQMVVSDMPNIFTLHRVLFSLQHPWLENYKMHGWADGTLKYRDINEELRQQRVGR